jgi:AcrR family transcriptional regulator
MISSTGGPLDRTSAGRRPGHPDTRSEIIASARALFTETGYERASLRAIARQAGVDPALVHHYFANKAALFVEALYMNTDPRVVAERIHAEVGSGQAGRDLVSAFLGIWDRPGRGAAQSFTSAVQAVSASREAADGLREFLMERVWSIVGRGEQPEVAALRRSLVASQLFGLGWTRYVLRLEPFASAPVRVLADWLGPTIDGWLTGPLPTARPSAPLSSAPRSSAPGSSAPRSSAPRSSAPRSRARR